MFMTLLFYSAILSFTSFMFVVFFVPSYFNTHMFVLALTTFIKAGKWTNVISMLSFSVVIVLNRSFMVIEDVLFPDLKRIADEFFT